MTALCSSGGEAGEGIHTATGKTGLGDDRGQDWAAGGQGAGCNCNDEASKRGAHIVSCTHGNRAGSRCSCLRLHLQISRRTGKGRTERLPCQYWKYCD
eukprot:1154694-Pelagomonas_calceolata.AAC.4